LLYDQACTTAVERDCDPSNFAGAHGDRLWRAPFFGTITLAAQFLMSDVFMEQLTELQKLVDHHVDEGESTGFRCACDEFDKDELEEMGTEFRRRKDELMVNAI
jgi:hypothetical protein